MRGSANLNIMVRAARRAGRALARDFREVENLQASVKGAGDFTFRAAVASARILREDLSGARPNYGWLAGEGDEVPGEDPTRRWIVDPLGGSVNFLHGLPHFAVSVALEHKGRIVAAVIHDPAREELFFAEQGAGAWMDAGRLRVSGRHRMAECILAAGIPAAAGGKGLPAMLRDLGRIIPVCAGVRHLGCPALSLAYVAAGRHDGYWERGVKVPEIAAGLLLVAEAGGLTTAIRDGQAPLEHGEVIAAGGEIFDRFAGAVKGAPDTEPRRGA